MATMPILPTAAALARQAFIMKTLFIPSSEFIRLLYGAEWKWVAPSAQAVDILSITRDVARGQ